MTMWKWARNNAGSRPACWSAVALAASSGALFAGKKTADQFFHVPLVLRECVLAFGLSSLWRVACRLGLCGGCSLKSRVTVRACGRIALWDVCRNPFLNRFSNIRRRGGSLGNGRDRLGGRRAERPRVGIHLDFRGPHERRGRPDPHERRG